MNTRLMKYSLVAGLALVLSLPALAYSQYGPQGPRLAPGGGAGRNLGAAEGGARQRGPQRFEGRGVAPQRRFAARPGRPGGFGAGFAVGVGAEFGGRGVRSGLAVRALSQADQIGLTDEQREQITEAQHSHREASINRRAATQIAELELRELIRADTADIAAVETKMREVSEQRIAELTSALRLNAAVSEILTAEQMEQLDERGQGPDSRGARRNRDRRGDPIEQR